MDSTPAAGSSNNTCLFCLELFESNQTNKFYGHFGHHIEDIRPCSLALGIIIQTLRRAPIYKVREIFHLVVGVNFFGIEVEASPDASINAL